MNPQVEITFNGTATSHPELESALSHVVSKSNGKAVMSKPVTTPTPPGNTVKKNSHVSPDHTVSESDHDARESQVTTADLIGRSLILE